VKWRFNANCRMKTMASCAAHLNALALLFLLAPLVYGQNNKHFALLPKSQTTAISQLCSRSGPKIEGSWKPTKDDIDGLESSLSLISKLKSEGDKSDVHIKTPSSYYRQYLGVLVDGRRLIYLNAFAPSLLRSDWRDRLVDICDGGTIAWGVLYDPEKREFSRLTANGGF
jgi:hypothetical protein